VTSEPAQIPDLNVGDRVVVEKLYIDEWAVVPANPPNWLIGRTATVIRIAGNQRSAIIRLDEVSPGQEVDHRVVTAGLRPAP
jgi:hypothetical protein